MVESSTIFIIAFFGITIAATPYAVKWLSDRNKGTQSEQESYEKYKETPLGKITDPYHTDVVGGISNIVDYINSRTRKD